MRNSFLAGVITPETIVMLLFSANLLIIGIFTGVEIGKVSGRNEIKREAVKVGAAEYKSVIVNSPAGETLVKLGVRNTSQIQKRTFHWVKGDSNEKTKN